MHSDGQLSAQSLRNYGSAHKKLGPTLFLELGATKIKRHGEFAALTGKVLFELRSRSGSRLRVFDPLNLASCELCRKFLTECQHGEANIRHTQKQRSCR
jgi:hypothetical protein